MVNQFSVLATLLSLISLASVGTLAYGQQGSATKQANSSFTQHETPPEGLQEIYETCEAGFGFVPNVIKVMAGSPALTKSYIGLQGNLREHATLSSAEINIVQMAIAVENKCTYCTAAHTMAGKAFYQTPEKHMLAVSHRKQLDDPKLQALRNFAVAVYQSHGHAPEPAVNAFYEAGYSQAQALDVVACIAAKVMTNYANALGGTELDAALEPLAAGLDL